MAVNAVSPVYQELVEYLAQSATPEQILAFKVSDAMQQRADELLDKNNEGELTAEEAAELQQMLQFERMVLRLKTSATLALNANQKSILDIPTLHLTPWPEGLESANRAELYGDDER